jgi:PAS domain S-box-containing protein
LISEVVTNVVLHARCRPVVRLSLVGDTLRVEVDDTSPTIPSRRRYELDAATGRGLALVDSLATAWGAVPTASGKTVWFELGERARPAPAPAPRGMVERRAESASVAFLNLPTALVRATLEHGDAILRELEWTLYFEEEGSTSAAPVVDLGPLLDALATATYEGRSHIDVVVDLPAGSADAALKRLALIDEGDRAAVDGELLIPAAVPEIASCRNWLLGEIAKQAEGRPPEPWAMPASDELDDHHGLEPSDVARLGAADVVVADTANRIQFVGADVARALGWAPKDLVGRRLTTIIPAELREAHLAGFTRYQTLGEQSILGRRVELPAATRGGATRDVQVTIEVVSGADGHRLYRAQISPVR